MVLEQWSNKNKNNKINIKKGNYSTASKCLLMHFRRRINPLCVNTNHFIKISYVFQNKMCDEKSSILHLSFNSGLIGRQLNCNCLLLRAMCCDSMPWLKYMKVIRPHTGA